MNVFHVKMKLTCVLHVILLDGMSLVKNAEVVLWLNMMENTVFLDLTIVLMLILMNNQMVLQLILNMKCTIAKHVRMATILIMMSTFAENVQ